MLISNGHLCKSNGRQKLDIIVIVKIVVLKKPNGLAVKVTDTLAK